MFQVTKATEYAILLLVSLAKSKGKPLSLTKICKSKGLPLKYLEKIASLLKEKGVVVSKEGVKGGYLLVKGAKEISLMDICQAVEGKKGLVSCLYGSCPKEDSCLHKKTWIKLQKVLEKELNKIKLNDLIN